MDEAIQDEVARLPILTEAFQDEAANAEPGMMRLSRMTVRLHMRICWTRLLLKVTFKSNSIKPIFG